VRIAAGQRLGILASLYVYTIVSIGSEEWKEKARRRSKIIRQTLTVSVA
jgi:hypothetical protein